LKDQTAFGKWTLKFLFKQSSFIVLILILSNLRKKQIGIEIHKLLKICQKNLIVRIFNQSLMTILFQRFRVRVEPSSLTRKLLQDDLGRSPEEEGLHRKDAGGSRNESGHSGRRIFHHGRLEQTWLDF